jgi:hypothetical protein
MKTISEIKQIKLSDKAKMGIACVGATSYFAGLTTCVIKGAAAPTIAKVAVLGGIAYSAYLVGDSIHKRFKQNQLDKANFMANIIIHEPVKLKS